MLPTGDCGEKIVCKCELASDEEASPVGGEPICGGDNLSMDWKVPLNRDDFCAPCIAGGDIEWVTPRGADFSSVLRRPFISGEGLINSTIMLASPIVLGFPSSIA